MQFAIVFLALVAAASAGAPLAYSAGTYLTRAPAYDSAVIKSDRLGGNFAYSVAESHAYAAHTPIVQQVTSPVGVSYSAGAPVVTGYSTPAVHAVSAPAVAAYSSGPIAYNAAPYAYNASPYAYNAAPYAYNSGFYGGYPYAAPAYGYNAFYKK